MKSAMLTNAVCAHGKPVFIIHGELDGINPISRVQNEAYKFKETVTKSAFYFPDKKAYPNILWVSSRFYRKSSQVCRNNTLVFPDSMNISEPKKA